MISDKIRAQWQIAASGLLSLIAELNSVPKAYVAQQERVESLLRIPSDLLGWMKFKYGMSTSLGLVFPSEVYEGLFAMMEGYFYGNTRIVEGKEPPGNISVVGDTISCDLPVSGVIRLYAWNFVAFDESEITGVVNGSQLVFSDVPAGVYVLADNSFEKFPSSFLTVA